ncbi:MAG: hypothetical protein WC924_03025 [Candidatus Gracilibacteria bacterium]
MTTPDGQHFVGTQVSPPKGGIYTGTVAYPSGSIATGKFERVGDLDTSNFYPVDALSLTTKDGATLRVSVDRNDDTEETATYIPKGEDSIKLPGDPKAGDFNWRLTFPEENSTREKAYSFNLRTGALTYQNEHPDPSGVEKHNKITEDEVDLFTGYGKYAEFPEESPYKAYEGYWKNGWFDGEGTLVLRNGQTLQGTFKEDVPSGKAYLEFKKPKGVSFERLQWLDDGSWMSWTDKKAGKWDRYTWDNYEQKIVITHMVKPPEGGSK